MKVDILIMSWFLSLLMTFLACQVWRNQPSFEKGDKVILGLKITITLILITQAATFSIIPFLVKDQS